MPRYRDAASLWKVPRSGRERGPGRYGIDPDGSIAVPCYLTLPDEMPYLLEDMLVSECLRVLRIVDRADTLSRRYGWRTRWLPLPSVEPLPYPEWRAYFVGPTKPDSAFEHMQAHNV